MNGRKHFIGYPRHYYIGFFTKEDIKQWDLNLKIPIYKQCGVPFISLYKPPRVSSSLYSHSKLFPLYSLPSSLTVSPESERKRETEKKNAD